MKKAAIVLFGLSFVSCGDTIKGAVEDVCGPCPDVASGELAVTGSAQVDGFFKALNYFQNANARISGEFQAHLDALAEAYGVDCAGETLSDCAGLVKAEIQADVSANVEGGLKIDYVPPRCSANAEIMVEAQAECTAEADIDCTPPEVEPGSIEVACEGQCTGSCSAECEGSCVVEAPSVSCSGKCEGACDLSVAGTCEGKCHGTCDGTCEVQDANGNCKGACDGDCTGTCELAVAASCSGNCTGKCVGNPGSATCEGECRGECSGSCTGSCTGKAEPPSVTAPDCDADIEADCKASASAQASASLECTPPRLEVDFEFAAGVTAEAQAQFLARLTVLKAEFIGIMKGLVNARILIEGDATAGIPSIEDVLTAQIEAAGDLGFDGLAGITPYGIVCAAPALLAATDTVADAASELTATLTASVEIAGAIGL